MVRSVGAARISGAGCACQHAVENTLCPQCAFLGIRTSVVASRARRKLGSSPCRPWSTTVRDLPCVEAVKCGILSPVCQACCRSSCICSLRPSLWGCRQSAARLYAHATQGAGPRHSASSLWKHCSCFALSSAFTRPVLRAAQVHHRARTATSRPRQSKIERGSKWREAPWGSRSATACRS